MHEILGVLAFLVGGFSVPGSHSMHSHSTHIRHMHSHHMHSPQHARPSHTQSSHTHPSHALPSISTAITCIALKMHSHHRRCLSAADRPFCATDCQKCGRFRWHLLCYRGSCEHDHCYEFMPLPAMNIRRYQAHASRNMLHLCIRHTPVAVVYSTECCQQPQCLTCSGPTLLHRHFD